MKPYLLLVLALVLFSCDKEEPVNCCVNIDTQLMVHYMNALGENLIDSDDQYDRSQIKIYFKDGDDYRYAYNNLLDLANYHKVLDVDDQLVIQLFPSDIYEGNYSTTLIEINENLVDTLVTEFEFVNGVQAKRVWVNGEEASSRNIALSR